MKLIIRFSIGSIEPLYMKLKELRKHRMYPVGEWYNHFDKRYSNWWFGRIEVYRDDEPYNIDEWRYCLSPDKKWLLRLFESLFCYRGLTYIELVAAKYVSKLLNNPPTK